MIADMYRKKSRFIGASLVAVVVAFVFSIFGANAAAQAVKAPWNSGCGPELVQVKYGREARKDDRLVPLALASSRPEVDVSHACLMKAVAMPTTEMLDELIRRVEMHPGAWSRDFYELKVRDGTLNAVFWPRPCVSGEETDKQDWTAVFRDRYVVPGSPRMRTAIALLPDSAELVGNCLHQIWVTPAKAAEAEILSGKGLSEKDLHELFRLMMHDPKAVSLSSYIASHANKSAKYGLAWQIGGDEAYVLTFDFGTQCVPLGLFNSVASSMPDGRYYSIDASAVPRPDDSRCIASVQSRWISR